MTAAGGLAFALPTERPEEAVAYVANLDGLLFSGGKDIDPSHYGEEPIKGIGSFDPERDEWELALFKAAAAKGLPIFGICRGHQLVNIALGGSLFQDLANQCSEAKLHNPEDFPVDKLFHRISIAGESLVHKIFGDSGTRVNSFHHQAVKKLGTGLKVSATALDGVVEAFESTNPTHFILGVQFHPESLTLNYPVFLGLFSAFVDASRKRAIREY